MQNYSRNFSCLILLILATLGQEIVAAPSQAIFIYQADKRPYCMKPTSFNVLKPHMKKFINYQRTTEIENQIKTLTKLQERPEHMFLIPQEHALLIIQLMENVAHYLLNAKATSEFNPYELLKQAIKPIPALNERKISRPLAEHFIDCLFDGNLNTALTVALKLHYPEASDR